MGGRDTYGVVPGNKVVRYVTMVLAVCILRYASNICEQGRKGTQVLYYIVTSMYVLRRTISIEVTSNIDIILV